MSDNRGAAEQRQARYGYDDVDYDDVEDDDVRDDDTGFRGQSRSRRYTTYDDLDEDDDVPGVDDVRWDPPIRRAGIRPGHPGQRPLGDYESGISRADLALSGSPVAGFPARADRARSPGHSGGRDRVDPPEPANRSRTAKVQTVRSAVLVAGVSFVAGMVAGRGGWPPAYLYPAGLLAVLTVPPLLVDSTGVVVTRFSRQRRRTRAKRVADRRVRLLARAERRAKALAVMHRRAGRLGNPFLADDLARALENGHEYIGRLTAMPAPDRLTRYEEEALWRRRRDWLEQCRAGRFRRRLLATVLASRLNLPLTGETSSSIALARAADRIERLSLLASARMAAPVTAPGGNGGL